MERHGEEIHINTEDVRGGRTMKVMRFVLAISILLAIVALALVWAATRTSVPDINQAAPTQQAS